MPITLNGSGTVSGISVGGLPDGIIQSADFASGVGGKVLAVSESLKKDSFSTQNNTFTDITGLSVTMTPASTSSKFLVSYNVCFSPRDYNYSGAIRCVKVVGGTTTDDIYVGDAASNRVRCSNFSYSVNAANAPSALQTQSGSFLHSPNTTSAVTFKMQCCLLGTYGWANDVFVNRTNTWGDTAFFGSPVSSIVVTEVAA